MKEIEDSFNLQVKQKNIEFEKKKQSLVQRKSESLQELEKQFKEASDVHEREVRTLFENKGTLKFVKELRFFKSQWQAQKTEKKRKKIASAMANATKKWVGDGELVK